MTTIFDLNCRTTRLRRRSRGKQVLALQEFLKQHGWYKRRLDSFYGPYTTSGVRRLQRVLGIKRDGFFGSITCRKTQEKYRKEPSPGPKPQPIPDLDDTSKEIQEKIKELLREAPRRDDIQAFLVLGENQVNPPKTEPITPGGENTQTPWKRRPDWQQELVGELEDLSLSMDAEDLSSEATFNLNYAPNTYILLARYRQATLHIYKNGEEVYTLYGFINKTQRTRMNNRTLIQVGIAGYKSFLEQTILIRSTDKRSRLLETICNAAGLVLELDLDGLNDSENYTLDTIGSNSSSSGGMSGTDSEKRKAIFREATTWRYVGGGGGSSSDPVTAYQWTKSHRQCDCFGASASLFYQFKNYTKIGVRIVVGYSPYARSRTHRTIQLKENGSWVDPPEYRNMTRNLRVLTRYPRHTYGGYIRE